MDLKWLEKYVEVYILMIIFAFEILLSLVFIEYFWLLSRIQLVEIRLVDQIIKLMVFLFFWIVWIYIFKEFYYRSYRLINRCKGD